MNKDQGWIACPANDILNVVLTIRHVTAPRVSAGDHRARAPRSQIMPAAAQCGLCVQDSGAVNHHDRRQMGRDVHSRRSALLTAERKFWRCVESREAPSPIRY